MISLVGGELYQWDTGRIVRVVPDENVKVHEVHFSTKRMDYAYVLKTYIVDGVTYCAIPNIILQQSNRLLCYEVCENSDGEETIANTYFDIIKRNRPEDYVYTEQEHFTIQALSDRVDKLEESSHTHNNKAELDTITEEDLETWRSPVTAAVTGGAQVGTLFEDLEVTTTLAEDASEWTSASSQPFKCTFRPSPGQMVVVKVKDLDVDTITIAKIPPAGYPLGQTIIGNYSVVNSRLQSWYNDADSVPPTPNDTQANSCLVFEDQYYDSEHLTPVLPTCILYTKTPGTYKVTVTTLKHSIEPESVMKMYDVRPCTLAEYGTYANWENLTKSGKYDLWEVSVKKTNYYSGVHLKEVDGTKYIYVYRSEQKEDPDSGTFTNTDYTLTYDTATETVTCSDTTINPETDVIISVHLDTVISTVPDKATSLGQPTSDKVGKMLTAVDRGEGTIDNKWQSRRYEYQWVDAPKADWSVNDPTDPSYVKNRVGYYAEKEAAKISSKEILEAKQTSGSVRLSTSDGIDVLDSSTEEIKNNIHLYYMNQRFRLKYKGDSQRGSTWEPITTSNYLQITLSHTQIGANIYFHVNINNLSNESVTINPGDIIVVYPDPIKIPNNLIPNASDTSTGGVRTRVISSEDLNNDEYNTWYSSSNIIASEEGSLLSASNIVGGREKVFTATLLSGHLSHNNGLSMIFGSADDTVSSLGLVKDDFPIIVTKYGTIYDNRPTFQYLIFTASGKKGTFDIRAGSKSTSSPITWTFEGGGQSDWSQNDETAIDYVKNRTHYMASEYYDKQHRIHLSTAGNITTISEHSTIPFVLGEEVHIFNGSLEELTYEAPYIVKEDENGELYVGTSPFRIYRNKIRSLNSWVQQSGISTIIVQRKSAFKPGKQLDPKFIPEMYYTEENVTELGNTYEDWLTASDDGSGSHIYKPLSFLFDGQIYKDVIPEANSTDFIHYDLSSDGKRITIWRNSEIFTTTPENTPFQIVEVNDNPTIHKIPSKYIELPELFIITPTYNSDTKTWSTDRTWDEVKAAAAKSENPNDYAIVLDDSLLSPNVLNVTKNSGGEITSVNMQWANVYPMIFGKDETSEGFPPIVPVANYLNASYQISSSGAEFKHILANKIPQPVVGMLKVTKSNDGSLACIPPNTIEYCCGFLIMQDDNPQVICPLFYDGETYHYESFEEDSSNILSLYFSTVTNGIYRRLKITQGQNGAADTVMMDKEIKLNKDNNDSYRTKQLAISGTFSSTSGVSNDLHSIDINIFTSLCEGIDSVYLTIGVGTEYELKPGGMADGIYSLMYNGKTAITLNTRGTLNHLNFSSPFNTEEDGTDFCLYAMQFNQAILPRIDVDGTTIKFNEQSQLTLALSNANGVSF